jgi:CheY-like chemotaxis protein
MDTLRPMADSKSIQLTTQFDPSGELILGDPDRLQQVVWNLLSNAIKFTPEEGKVEVSLSFGEGTIASDDGQAQPQRYAQIQVIDTGIGISPEFLPYVFDRFRQADSTTTRPYGGLGLGLAIVRHLVELHGGTVEATSNPDGPGARFTVKLPQAATLIDPQGAEESYPMTHQGTVNAEIPSLSSLRVLVVDDDPDTREFLSTALAQYGAEVNIVSSVADAVTALGDFKPNVLVSDIGMPEADGYQLIRRIRSLEAEQGGSIPAIALTAYTRVEERKRAIEAGFQMHLAKPIEPGELVAAVAKLVQPASQLQA